jgi:hypothetical protein
MLSHCGLYTTKYFFVFVLDIGGRGGVEEFNT